MNPEPMVRCRWKRDGVERPPRKLSIAANDIAKQLNISRTEVEDKLRHGQLVYTKCSVWWMI